MVGITSTVIAAGIGAAGAIGGAALANKGAKDAAKAQTKAADQANATQLQIFNQQRADAEPWRQIGGQALDLMGSLYGFTPTFKPTQAPANTNTQTQTQTQQYGQAQQVPAQGYQGLAGKGNRYFDMTPAEQQQWQDGYQGYQASAQQQQQPTTQASQTTSATGVAGADPMAWLSKMPGYQFRLKEGANALNTSIASRGMAESGAAIKAATRYGQDYASNEFNNEWNRLAGLAGVGQAVNSSNNALATNYANNVSQNQLAAGQARSSSYAQQGQTNANLFGNLAGIGSNIAGSWASGGSTAGKLYNKGY